MTRIVLKPRKARTFLSRHPWVLDSSIASVEGSPADGDEVELYTDKARFLARGLFNSKSRIRVRLYSWVPGEAMDERFWRTRIETALSLRKLIGYDDPQGAARLVFSEGDGLSGLVVDRYAEYLVVQVTSLGVAQRLGQVVPALVDLLQPRGIVVRTEKAIAKSEGITIEEGVYWGKLPASPLIVPENGLRYAVDLSEGQKTGLYLDQRENRVAAARYLRGRRVLDMFCYAGGFSLAAARHGARECIGYDSSQKAVEQARANATLNELGNVRFETGEGFEVLESMVAAGERFGAIILDPPKFARTRNRLDEALRAYHWLNRLAMLLLEPGGVLATCSCSGAVSREDFFFMLHGAAQQAGRQIQILEQRGASPDHPVAANCPESEYLKCFICRVL